MKIPFIGQSYVYRNLNFDAQRCINWYPIKSETGTSKNIDGLQATPGKEEFCDLGNGGIRGSWQTLGRAFSVSGNKLYEIYSDGTFELRGQLRSNIGYVDMDDNGQQLVLVDGVYGYILNLSTNVFSRITSPAWTGSATVCYIDGYFIFVRPDSGVFYISDILDGLSLDALEFASAEGSPDNLVACAALQGKLWLFGTQTVQIYYDSADPQFPFDPIDGAFIQYGCAAAHSVANSANTVFWLGSGTEGDGIVWMATGYQPQRVSTFAVEYAISTYGDVSDAIGYTYEEEGHFFYALCFPSANTTWFYDINLQQWHERAYWNTQTGRYERDRAVTHIFAFGKHLVGDWKTGKIFEQSLDLLDDDGDVIRRLRSSPHTFDSDNLNYIYYHRFQLDMMTGIGNLTDPNPQMSLAWSNDGGHTWSNEHTRSAGRVGNYKARAIWRALGRSRDRVFRVITTARARLTLIAAHVEATKGNS